MVDLKILMINQIKKKLSKNTEIVALTLIVIIAIISMTYYNSSKIKVYNNYKDIIDNVFFKKTINHIVNNLEPKFKKISHKVSIGETFVSILEGYSISRSEIQEIKNKLSKKTNINKLSKGQKIEYINQAI